MRVRRAHTHTNTNTPQVPFLNAFNPKDSGGNVERWLIECEIAMRDTVKSITRKSFDAHINTPRIKWVLQLLCTRACGVRSLALSVIILA